MSESPNPAHLPPIEAFEAVVDIELTSRCNASCTFCPRDKTAHLGLIEEATFTTALGRAVEYRDALLDFAHRQPGWFDTHDDTIWLSLCGMGEPLIHPRATEYVGRIVAAGLRPIVNTNASLLGPDTAEELLDAGLAMACLNVGEIDEDYEAVYGLPFERTRSNVEHFLEAAAGRCTAMIVLVDHHDDPGHVASVREYWSARGATAFMLFKLVNRAGALAVDEQVVSWHRAYGSEARRLIQAQGDEGHCWAPFLYPFIGYDGNYYLCSSDWGKEVSLGNVFEHALVDLLDEKAAQVGGRSPICSGCTHHPTNAMARALARAAEGRTDVGDYTTTPAGMLAALGRYSSCVAAMRADIPRAVPGRGSTTRRLIPVRS